MTSPQRSTVWLSALLLWGLLVYAPSLFNGFVDWDDTFLIIANEHIRSLSPGNLLYVFTHFDPELYIPLTFVSYQLNYLIAGASPFAFHAVSLV